MPKKSNYRKNPMKNKRNIRRQKALVRAEEQIEDSKLILKSSKELPIGEQKELYHADKIVRLGREVSILKTRIISVG